MQMTKNELDELKKITTMINNLYKSLESLVEAKENVLNNISCIEIIDKADDEEDYVMSLALDEIDALYNIRIAKVEELKKQLKNKFDIDFIQNESW